MSTEILFPIVRKAFRIDSDRNLSFIIKLNIMKILKLTLMSGLSAFAISAFFYESPIKWGLRSPRSFEECVVVGGQVVLTEWKEVNIALHNECIWKGKKFFSDPTSQIF